MNYVLNKKTAWPSDSVDPVEPEGPNWSSWEAQPSGDKTRQVLVLTPRQVPWGLETVFMVLVQVLIRQYEKCV